MSDHADWTGLQGKLLEDIMREGDMVPPEVTLGSS